MSACLDRRLPAGFLSWRRACNPAIKDGLIALFDPPQSAKALPNRANFSLGSAFAVFQVPK
jgi:hypothetical protein